jgi:hypothetical protein
LLCRIALAVLAERDTAGKGKCLALSVERQALPILIPRAASGCPFGKATFSSHLIFELLPVEPGRGFTCVDPVGAEKTVSLVEIGEYNDATLPPNPASSIAWPTEFRFL